MPEIDPRYGVAKMHKVKSLQSHRLVASFLGLLVLLPAVLQVGCGGSSQSSPAGDCPTCSASGGTASEPLPSTVTRVATFKAYKADADAPAQFYREDGTPISADDLKAAFAALPKDPNKSVGIQILNEAPPAPGTAQSRYVQVGCLWMDVRWEEGPVSKCFKLQGVQWHLNFHFKNACSNQDYFNIHAKAWWDNGPQFGLYESVRQWCFRSVGKWTAIRGKFMEALAAAGVTGVAAYVISDISAGVCVAAFAL